LRLPSGILPQLVPLLVSQLQPIHVGYYKAELHSTLAPQDVVSIMSFQDAVYSDLPSSREMAKSLEAPQKSPNAKLEMLTTVFLDRKLSRQMADYSIRNSHIKSALAKAGSSARSCFLCHIPLWHEATTYGYDFLTSTLPRIYEDITRDTLTDKSQVGWHFSKSVLEFGALAASLLLISRRTNSTPSNTLLEWRRVLRAQDKDAIYGNPYLFELWTLLTESKDAGVGQARLLISNFIGTYAEHKDPLRSRITWLFQFAESDTATAREQLLESLFCALLDATAVTENTFGLVRDHISENDRRTVLKAYREWCAGASVEPLLSLLDALFVSRDPNGRPPRIAKMLAQITPTVADIIKGAQREYAALVPADVLREVVFRSEAAPGEWLNLHVLGRDSLLIRTVAHLVQNAIQHRCGKSYDTRRPDGLAIELQVSQEYQVAEDLQIVTLNVIDNSEDMSIAACKSTFLQTGGLSAQQKALLPWGANLDVDKLPDNRTRYFVNLLRCDPIDITKRLNYE
jgi:hypothetical protein